ncbi:hypothetical protein [Planktotalea arctica]|uniref:hypothetical protein n=1 Tax=Planktotalea arctica TaxID=1481893 RepID=UPI000A16EA53|nr:hypothetical protein [Planktotalea arctica]
MMVAGKENGELPDTDVTFALASEGHNADIFSEPGHPHQSFQIGVMTADRYADPQSWVAETDNQYRSWWEAWVTWLGRHSSAQTTPPAIGRPKAGSMAITDAPRTYVKAGDYHFWAWDNKGQSK